MQFRLSRFFNRWLWVQCHLYLALTFGLVFALIGLTGSLNLYRDSIDELFNPQLVVSATDQPPLSLDKILVAVKKAHPDRNGAWTLEMPSAPNRSITAWFDKPRESVDKRYAPLMVAVNPYNGEILASRFWGQTLTTWILDLHSDLQLENSGRNWIAAMAVLMLISVGSGLYLWWPGLSGLKNAFTLRGNSLIRLLFDLHRLTGLFSAGCLLLLAFTGFHLAYPQLLETLTAAEGMGHGDGGPNVRSTAVANNRPVSISEAILVARGLFPSSDVRRITTPLGDIGTYRINLRQKHELNQHHPFTTVWVDRWSGQIRAVNNPSQFTSGQTFTTWQWPLHTGEAFGDWGKLLWFFAGLAPTFLFVSGLLHWLFRRGLVTDKRLDLGKFTQTTLQRGKRMAVIYGHKLLNLAYPLCLRIVFWLRRRLS
jgi:uncharacterized iron-regulated membrane protein